MNTVERPFAESCVQNRDPIFAVIAPRLSGCRDLLEIGSGTGQHAVYFAPQLSHLNWQTSDRAENHAGIRQWLAAEGSGNILAPLCLDVVDDPWPAGPYDAVFSANTAHIMDEPAVAAMFTGVSRVLRPGGLFLLYGPFAYDGRHTADSNVRFDAWLKARDPAMGVRDVSWLTGLAAAAGMVLHEDVGMPADNRTLVWLKS
ncbi:MAG: DUF938 domain-containing protein [Gammaproteobacteria bacterium]|nr:DUF938 domain-containing protein [Gammaproteobacteria bacterium]